MTKASTKTKAKEVVSEVKEAVVSEVKEAVVSEVKEAVVSEVKEAVVSEVKEVVAVEEKKDKEPELVKFRSPYQNLIFNGCRFSNGEYLTSKPKEIKMLRSDTAKNYSRIIEVPIK